MNALVLLTVLFILLVILIAKAPKVGIGLVIALVVMGVVAVLGLSLRSVAVQTSPSVGYEAEQWRPHARSEGDWVNMVPKVGVSMSMVGLLVLILLVVGIVLLLVKAPKVAAVLMGGLGLLFVLLLMGRIGYRRGAYTTERAPAVVTRSVQGSAVSPIWSEAMEAEFEADIYPSKAIAARALGMRVADAIGRMMRDANEPVQAFLFDKGGDRAVVTEFRRGMEQKAPDMRFSIEAEWREVNPGEVGITFAFQVRHSESEESIRDWPVMPEHGPGGSGEILATASTADRQVASAATAFISKPWVANFADFANAQPNRHFLIARSVETCTSPNEARQQAMQDAVDQLHGLLGPMAASPAGRSTSISGADLEQGGFLVDQFVQSFDGSAGRVWRHALLIDAAPEKLARLGERVRVEVRHERHTWARMLGSALGVFAVIVVTYFFLNMATRGYYDWSLRIAGLVLAIVAVIFIFLLT